MQRILGLAEIHRSSHVTDLFDGNSLVQKLCNAQKDVFSHAVGEDICGAVHQNGAAHLVVPIIVVSKAAQGGLQAANDDRHVTVSLTDAVAIDDHRSVGTLAHHSPGGVVIKGALLFCGSIMGNHTVNVSRGDQKAQTGTPVFHKSVTAFVIGLRKDRNTKSRLFQHSGNNGNTKGRVIHVSIARYVNKVGSVPTPCLHIRAADR